MFTPVKARTPAKAREAVRPATTAAKRRTPAKAKAAARPMAASQLKAPAKNNQRAFRATDTRWKPEFYSPDCRPTRILPHHARKFFQRFHQLRDWYWSSRSPLPAYPGEQAGSRLV